MEIIKNLDNETLTVSLQGRLDTTTAPTLESSLKDDLSNIKSLIIDLKELEYISSAGLRVLLALQKIMNDKGELIIKNVKPEVNEVFEITGFDGFLTIK